MKKKEGEKKRGGGGGGRKVMGEGTVIRKTVPRVVIINEVPLRFSPGFKIHLECWFY